MGLVHGIAHLHVLDSKHYQVGANEIPIKREQRDDNAYAQCSMVLGPVDVRRWVNQVIPGGVRYEDVSWKTYLKVLSSAVKIQIQHEENPRGQSPFGVRCFALVDLCLLSSFELSLELVAQGEQPPFRHLAYVVHVEDKDLENHDVRSVPSVLGSHRQKKHQGPERVIRDGIKPTISREDGRLRDKETNQSQKCRKAVHTKSEKCYSLERRGVTERSVSSRKPKTQEAYVLKCGKEVLLAAVVDHIRLIQVPESTQVPTRV